MKLSVSFLNIKNNIKDSVKKLDSLNIDYLHLDVMDGKFVSNFTYDIGAFTDYLEGHTKPLDVHLMVMDIKKYVDMFSKLNPEYITFHLEASNDPLSIIEYIKELGIRVGISIKPNTNIGSVLPYLSDVDLVLVMSVEPGMGGQNFIENSVSKINQLYDLREKHEFNYVIEVDGGINNINKELCDKADILVVGSYITNEDYETQISKMINK